MRAVDLLSWYAGQALPLLHDRTEFMQPDDAARRAFDYAEALLRERAARLRRWGMI